MRFEYRTYRALRAAALMAATASCGDQPRLPTAPSTLSTGIVIFQDVNYRGKSAHVERDTPDLSTPEGPCEHESGGDYPSVRYDWDDCVSSIRVSPGTRAVIYVNRNFQGFARTIDQDVPNLRLLIGPCTAASLDDCISSIRVMPQ